MPPIEPPSAGRLPVWLLATSAVASATIAGVGFSLRSGIGIWLACCAIIGWLLAAGGTIAARRLARRPPGAGWQDRPTGKTLQPLPFPEAPPPAFRWVGGCNVPGSLGRLNASFGLAVLEVASGSATLRVRPHFIATIFGAGKPMTFTPAADLTAFPVRGTLGTKGVGFQHAGHPPYYFWTGEREMVLTVLATAGFHTSWAETKARLY